MVMIKGQRFPHSHIKDKKKFDENYNSIFKKIDEKEDFNEDLLAEFLSLKDVETPGVREGKYNIEVEVKNGKIVDLNIIVK